MSTEVAKVDKPRASLRDLLTGDEFKKQIANALPSHLKPERFIRIALTDMTRTPGLQKCSPESFFKCLLDLSAFGLEPDGRRAHLIPFENRKLGVTECQLLIDYKGLVELIMRSGQVSTIHADIVCENDEFEVNCGTVIKHKIDYRKERGPMYAAYATCKFKDGCEKSDVMTKIEIEAIRRRSRAGESGPWKTDYNEMAKKTVFRRLSKWLPLSPELREAVEHDDKLTIDLPPIQYREAASTAILAEKTAEKSPETVQGDVLPPETGTDNGEQPDASLEGMMTP